MSGLLGLINDYWEKMVKNERVRCVECGIYYRPERLVNSKKSSKDVVNLCGYGCFIKYNNTKK